MKCKRLTVLLLLLALLSACAGGTEKEKGPYVLYFRSLADTGPALVSQSYEGEGVPAPEALVKALLSGPTEEGLVSPFPARVSLLSWEQDVENPGHLRLWLSEQYGALTDISLTLADYCIVLTLSQLDEVESVEIISPGHSVNYRSHQIMRAEEVLLTDEAAG